MPLIDTHFHLDYYRNHKQWYDWINFNKQYTICVTNSPQLYYSCTQLYAETNYIRFALGYNPKISVDTPFMKNMFMFQLRNASYIGEVGLDFSQALNSTSNQQIEDFEFICSAVSKQPKIMSIHTKYAENEVLRILKTYNLSNVIIHWYSGNISTLSKLIDLGCYFSVNSDMCLSQKGKTIISKIPLNKLLIESDGPFSRINSKRYTPDKLADIYNFLGETINCKDIFEIINSNFLALNNATPLL